MSGQIRLEIRRPDRDPSEFYIEPGVYTVGSDDDCKISLPNDKVDGRHAILTVNESECWIEDLDSASGTSVGGRKISGRSQVLSSQEIGIGPFVLIFDFKPAATLEKKLTPAPEPQKKPSAPEPSNLPADTAKTINPLNDLRPEVPEEIQLRRSVKQQVHEELVERMDIKRMALSKINRDEFHDKALNTIKEIVNDVADRLPPGITPESVIKEVYDEALRLGPLEDFLEDDTITEIMVNGPNQIYIEKKGKLTLSKQTFMDDASVMAIIERIVSPLGRRIDESQPYVDARLPDGSRVNAIIHPLSLIGPCLTIRKFSKIPFKDTDLIDFGTITEPITKFVRICVELRKNIVVSGGTGSGKTTLLNVFSNYIPSKDRIVTIEDAAELRLTQAHTVRLEARPPNIEGKGAITIRDLVRNSLRMRPDRIVVGECRGGEALDMLQAMNTGHDGSLTTVHANTPRDVISRLETMVLMSGMDLPVRAIREQIASAIDMIVHESRFSDGSRKVVKVTEIVGLEGEQITMQDIFEYVQTGIDENGKVLGHFRPTGAVPTFLEEIRSRGMSIDHSIFDPSIAKGKGRTD